MAARFEPNPKGIALAARTEGMVEAMTVVAEEIADVVRAIGPKDDDPDPHYVDAITVSAGIEGKTAKARVNAGKFTSNWIEFGTGEPGPTPAFAPIRRAAEAVGVRRVPGRKG